MREATHTPAETTYTGSVQGDELVHPIDPKPKKGDVPMPKKMQRKVIVIYIFLFLLGLGTGYVLSGKSTLSGKPTTIKTDKVTGSTDSKTFKDFAVGVIEKDGIAGEGTHKLIRTGGASQTVYLISSVVDLDEFIGKQVKVWGQTVAAKKAAWLMDVGKVELQQ